MNNTQELTETDWCIMAMLVTAVIAIAYLAGEDAALDDMYEARQADRIRIYCGSPVHNETLCASLKAAGRANP